MKTALQSGAASTMCDNTGASLLQEELIALAHVVFQREEGSRTLEQN